MNDPEEGRRAAEEARDADLRREMEEKAQREKDKADQDEADRRQREQEAEEAKKYLDYDRLFGVYCE